MSHDRFYRPILSADISVINLAVELVLISPRKSANFIVRLSSALHWHYMVRIMFVVCYCITSQHSFIHKHKTYSLTYDTTNVCLRWIIPATSVAANIGVDLCLNAVMTSLRSTWLMSPCSSPTTFSTATKTSKLVLNTLFLQFQECHRTI